jgi:hypothetical protein
MLTVALPVWRSKNIAWLCMESLCRMHKPKSEWELIVFEEKHEEQLGSDFFSLYYERLKEVGCIRNEYLTSIKKYPLSQKWVMIANQASLSSDVFCLCAADNYYSSYMLIEAAKYIKIADWVVTPRGYFYDFNLDKVMRFEWYSNVGLQMFAKTEKVRNFSLDVVNKGVDMWFAEKISPHGANTLIIESDHWKRVLCTNGLNTISTERVEFFNDPQPPFYDTKLKLEDIVHDDIYYKLKKLCRKLQ